MDYMSNFFQMSSWGPSVQGFASIGFILVTIWSLVWKGMALWKAGRLGQKVWFVILLVVNTLGILEIIYIFAVARKKEKAGQSQM